jgi:type IX secretion system PorP/SprF family membrane protein
VHRYFHVGLSATHLTEPTVRYQDSGSENDNGFEFFVPRQFYFMAGGNIPLRNPLYEIQPSMMVSTDLNVFTAEATVRLRYNKLFWGGIGYRWNDAVSILLGAEFKGFIVGYSYDLPVTAVLKASSGSHEVFVGYSMKLDLSDKNKTKHKSIRIL